MSKKGKEKARKLVAAIQKQQAMNPRNMQSQGGAFAAGLPPIYAPSSGKKNKNKKKDKPKSSGGGSYSGGGGSAPASSDMIAGKMGSYPRLAPPVLPALPQNAPQLPALPGGNAGLQLPQAPAAGLGVPPRPAPQAGAMPPNMNPNAIMGAISSMQPPAPQLVKPQAMAMQQPQPMPQPMLATPQAPIFKPPVV
jgi:hypothetical protein